MLRLSLLLALVLPPLAAQAQTATCDARCNQQQSECLKTCTGDPKEASKPDQAKRMMACLSTCEAQVKPCRQACTPTRQRDPAED